MEALQGFVNWSHVHHQFRQAWHAHLPKMQEWADSMGISLEVCEHLGLGYRVDKRAITWPERNDLGEIVGIGCRDIKTGRKYMVEGSSHGLIYAPDPEWGGVPEFIDHPILVIEGMTDVLACLMRNAYAIGKPSATGTAESNAYLEKVVKGKQIALLCENDGGIGTVAFLKDARRLVKHAKAIWTVEPPSEVKDLREWFKADEDAILWIEDQIRNRRPWSDDPGLVAVSPDVLEETAPLRIADQMILEKYTLFGETTLRYWNGLWYKFMEDHYGKIDQDYIRADVYRWLDGKKVLEKDGKGDNAEWIEKPYTPNTQKVNQIIDALKSRPEVLVPPETAMPCWLDDVPGRPRAENMICFKNGILDVKQYLENSTLEFMPPNPAWFSQTYCPYEFNPADIKKAQPFLDYLNEIFNGDEDSIKLLQEWLFYCMTSDTRLEKFMLFVGRPSAGKGTVMDVMDRVIGTSNIYYTRLDTMGTRFGLYGALGKTNIFMTDAHVSQVERGTTSLEVIKTVTGRGAVDVEGKGINAVSLLLNTKFTISVNELPNFQDTAAALRRRLLCLWFPNSYEGKADPDLKDRLTQADVIRGVAAWAMLGGRRLRAARKFTEPAISKSVAREFERTNTPVSAFIMEECKLEETAQVEKKKLFAVWVDWCRERGMAPGNQSSFGQKLLACLPNVKSSKGARDQLGRRQSVYVGLRPRTRFDVDSE